MNQLIVGDCLEWMRQQLQAVADMWLTSPPYEDARLYTPLEFKLKGMEWVDWCIPRIVEACRVTRGLGFFNAAGKVRQWKYHPVVEWLVTELTKNHGIVCGPSPYVFARVGIPGSGQAHYHRRDWEPVYCFAMPENVPPTWSDNTACGHPPKWAPGGAMSHRLSDGTRRNQWGGNATNAKNGRGKDGVEKKTPPRPSHIVSTKGDESYTPPVLANPGNVIEEKYTAKQVEQLLEEHGDILRLKVGGGLMGSDLAHENEAPFPEALAEFFIKSYCPPGGVAMDFCAGSGTVAAVAARLGRRYVAIDARESQIEIVRRRLLEGIALDLGA